MTDPLLDRVLETEVSRALRRCIEEAERAGEPLPRPDDLAALVLKRLGADGRVPPMIRMAALAALRPMVREQLRGWAILPR